MKPYEHFLLSFGCKSFSKLYDELKRIARCYLDLDTPPFSLSALEHPPGGRECTDVSDFLWRCQNFYQGDISELQAIRIIKCMKDNPPTVSHGNPKLPEGECSFDESNLIKHIHFFGIDLPGSKHNVIGNLEHFSSFFIDMFFGNYTEFMEHINEVSSKNMLRKTLDAREGYCQQSPIFAPILGVKMCRFLMNWSPDLTSAEKEKIKSMYTGSNENKFVEIVTKLIKLGADVTDYDIHGLTPLHHAIGVFDWHIIETLLKNGADPNAEARNGDRPLTYLTLCGFSPLYLGLIDTLVQYGGKLIVPELVHMLRSIVQQCGSIAQAVRVREAMPRQKNECEMCTKTCTRVCAACGLVCYCSPICQKLDWKFHKVSCKKNKKSK